MSGTFPGSLDYASITNNPDPFFPFTINPATPSVAVNAPTVNYTGSAYNALGPVTVTGVGNEGVLANNTTVHPTSLSYVYYSGTYNLGNLPATGSTTALPDAGAYTVVAKYVGGGNYTPAQNRRRLHHQGAHAGDRDHHRRGHRPRFAGDQRPGHQPPAVRPGEHRHHGPHHHRAGRSGDAVVHAEHGLLSDRDHHEFHRARSGSAPAKFPVSATAAIPGSASAATYFLVASLPADSPNFNAAVKLTVQFSVLPASPTQFIVTNPNGTVTAGTPFPLTVTPEDPFNNPTTYTQPVTVTSSNVADGATAGSPIVLSSTTLAAIGNKSAKLFLKAANNLAGQTPTTVTISTVAEVLATITGSTTVSVKAAPATRLVLNSPIPPTPPSSLFLPDGLSKLIIWAKYLGNVNTTFNTQTANVSANVADSVSGSLLLNGTATNPITGLSISNGVLNLGTLGVGLKTLGSQTLTISQKVAGGVTPQVTSLSLPLTVTVGNFPRNSR